MKICAALILGGLCASAALAVAQPQPPTPAPTLPPPPPPPPPAATAPPPPAPTVPTPPPASEAAPPPPGAQAAPAEEKKAEEKKEEEKAPPFEFALQGKNEMIAPYTEHDGKVEEGKIDVATDKNTLTVTLTGGAGANVFLGAHSEAVQSFRLIQEFDVTSTDPAISQVVLSLDSKLVGFVRSKHKASACVNLASITVTPVGWGSTPLAASLPRPCVGGNAHPCANPNGSMVKDPLPTITSPPMPLGRYVIDANFVITAEAGGLLDAHSTAIFSPEPKELDPWEREHNPYKGEDKTGYGFTTVITATPVGAPPKTAEAVWKQNLKKIRLAAKEAKEAKAKAEAAKSAANQPQYRQAFVPQPDYPQAVAPQPTLR
jgi:hypothetical protein